MYCNDNELESLVGLEILEEAWSVADDGNENGSKSSLNYSDLGDDTATEPLCLGKSMAVTWASSQHKDRQCLDASLGTASTVESTRITI